MILLTGERNLLGNRKKRAHWGGKKRSGGGKKKFSTLSWILTRTEDEKKTVAPIRWGGK